MINITFKHVMSNSNMFIAGDFCKCNQKSYFSMIVVLVYIIYKLIMKRDTEVITAQNHLNMNKLIKPRV